MRTFFTIIKVPFLFWLLGLTSLSFAQTEPNLPIIPISFGDFMERVGKYNLAYHAELLALDIALAEEESTKVFEDPSISFSATDNGERRNKMGYEFESALEWTLELGGKRSARMNAARSQVDLTRFLLSDYFNKLRADATTLFFKNIKERDMLDVKMNSYESMKKLAQADSIRFELGDIMEIDARQSNIEATLLFTELIQQKADWENTILQINRLMGNSDTHTDTFYQPEGKFSDADHAYLVEELLAKAQENRADLKAALQNKHLSQNIVSLVKAERRIDLDLSVGLGRNTVVNNTEAFTPAMTSVNAGIAIPLKFSNQNKGKLKAAQYAMNQSDLLYQDTKMEIQAEVYQALSQFQASKKQLQQFDRDLLNSAKRILEGKVYSYQRGESSLLEVLNAQRTFNEIQERYHESLFTYYSALITIQQVVGIWEITIN